MAPVFFFLAAIGAIAGAIGVATLRNPFYSVLALVSHLVALAALFLLLRAEFIAAAQVVVYAGAVMVLYVFVVAYVGTQAEPVRPAGGPGLKIGSVLFAGALAVELLIAVLGSGLKAINSEGAPYTPGFGQPAAIGELLLTRFLFPFEAASFLLLMAAVGAVVLARRRGGLEATDETEVPRIDVRLPAGTGSTKEGVGDINPTGSIDTRALTAPRTTPTRAGKPAPEELRETPVPVPDAPIGGGR
jgi:NADH:ubiquinone oxidoreductase subunit 6 (subunit J)